MAIELIQTPMTLKKDSESRVVNLSQLTICKIGPGTSGN